jgi:hypothetical protein
MRIMTRLFIGLTDTLYRTIDSETALHSERSFRCLKADSKNPCPNFNRYSSQLNAIVKVINFCIHFAHKMKRDAL